MNILTKAKYILLISLLIVGIFYYRKNVLGKSRKAKNKKNDELMKKIILLNTKKAK